ncbi:MAG: HDIG domain-containing metalloprotein [Bacteroidota bacterium]
MGKFSRRLSRRHLRAWEKDFIRLHLDERGQFLFFQMDPSDQKHSLAVAKTILAKRGFQTGVSIEPLVQAALLHDIGKVQGDLTPLSRLCVGLLKRVAPKLRAKWAKRSGGWFERACYVDLHHPGRGAYMARTFGVSPEVVAVIKAHHEPPRPGEPRLLTYLREADGRN